MQKYKIGLISLGCDKNRIDSEIILSALSEEFEITNTPDEADILIINTCGFIEASKQESIDTILEMAEYKKHNCKLLIATGCLTQRYSKTLQELIPEIDILLGVNDYGKLKNLILENLNSKKKICSCNYSDKNINVGNRILTTPNHIAYVRIAEGCSNYCTYCIIPKIRGKYRSRPIEDIVNEVSKLAELGVKEIILVAQDTTKYGEDLYNKRVLPDLIKKISEINSIEWIRLLYCYPEEITDELITEIAENKKVCKYIDIPIQHVSNTVLKRMNRKSSSEILMKRIKKLRENINGIALRTSIIVGFPGETEDDFNELKSFIKEIKFEKLGVFKYSQEEETPAAKMKDQIDENIKTLRENELMKIQREISNGINKDKIGKIYKVLIEGKNDEYWYGRNYEMTPEIDGNIIFKSDKILKIGNFVNVKITEALEYDLIGDVYYESCK